MAIINISLPSSLLEAADKQAEVELRNRSELIREALRVYLLQKGAGSTDIFSGDELDRVKNILDFGTYKEQKLIVLSSVFRPQPNTIPDLFAGSEAGVVKLLENPPHFRNSGWDLQTLDRAKPVAGEFLEVTNGIRKVIRIYRDGQIVLAGDEDFLGHGVNEQKNQTFAFNGLAIAELIANFVNFSHELSKFLETPPSKIIFKVQLRNPKREAIELKNIIRRFPLPEEVGKITLDLADREVIVPVNQDFNFQAAAYKLLGEFYYFFGLTEEKFWYVKKDKKEIDLDAFKEKN